MECSPDQCGSGSARLLVRKWWRVSLSTLNQTSFYLSKDTMTTVLVILVTSRDTFFHPPRCKKRWHPGVKSSDVKFKSLCFIHSFFFQIQSHLFLYFPSPSCFLTSPYLTAAAPPISSVHEQIAILVSGPPLILTTDISLFSLPL